MSGRNIYIELGVCELRYNTIPFYDDHKDEEWHYYLFEPNYLSLEGIREQLEEAGIPNLTLIPKAAWCRRCKKDLVWL